MKAHERKPASIDQQIKFMNDARKLLEKDPDILIIWTYDAIPVMQDVEENLIALRNLFTIERHEGLSDTSLQGCLDLVRREIRWNEVQQEELGTNRLRVFKAIEENLCALQIFANRMTEQLAQLPENSLKETEVRNG